MVRVLNESDNIEIILKQKLKLDFDVDYDEVNLDASDIYEYIFVDDKKVSEKLLKYLQNYNDEDEYKEVYNSISKVEMDFEYTSITVYITLNKMFTDEKLKFVFDDFIKDVVLEDEVFSSYTEVEIEPIEEPYESSYDGLNDEIYYSDSTIDSVEVDYEFEAIGEQEITISSK